MVAEGGRAAGNGGNLPTSHLLVLSVETSVADRVHKAKTGAGFAVGVDPGPGARRGGESGQHTGPGAGSSTFFYKSWGGEKGFWGWRADLAADGVTWGAWVDGEGVDSGYFCSCFFCFLCHVPPFLPFSQPFSLPFVLPSSLVCALLQHRALKLDPVPFSLCPAILRHCETAYLVDSEPCDVELPPLILLFEACGIWPPASGVGNLPSICVSITPSLYPSIPFSPLWLCSFPCLRFYLQHLPILITISISISISLRR